VALVVARPMVVYAAIFGPLIRFLNRSANWTVRRFGIEPQEELGFRPHARRARAADPFVRVRKARSTRRRSPCSNARCASNDKNRRRRARSRLGVEYVHPEDKHPDADRDVARHGVQRFPVCGVDLDDVVGVVHVKDVYRIPIERREDSSVVDIMTEAFVVPETRDLTSLLIELRTGSHLADRGRRVRRHRGIITLEERPRRVGR